MPALPSRSGSARLGNYRAVLGLVFDSCGNSPATAARTFEAAIVEQGVVLQFDNASWSCDLVDDGTFYCPTLEEGFGEQDGRVLHLERSARGVWTADGTIELQVQSRTWCDGPKCTDSPCSWAYEGRAVYGGD